MILSTSCSNNNRNNNIITGRTAGNRKDGKYMTEKIREYNINGTMIIGIDHGYGNIKSSRRVFSTNVIKSDSAPIFSKDYIEYDGKFYIIGEGHKSFVAEKQADEDNYILTMAAIAKELEARGIRENHNNVKIHLAVGLPLKWVQAQRGEFKEYLMREPVINFKYKGRAYEVEIAGCTVMPQCYAAVAENLRLFTGMNLLVDIGNGTMNLMYLNNGKAMESKSWTEKMGVFQCIQKISNKVLDETGTILMNEVIDNYLKTGITDIAEPYASLMRETAQAYVSGIFQKLRDYEFNEKLMKLYFMGGGARIVETVGNYDKERTQFNHDICATAKGYEYYCYMALRSQNHRK